MYPPQPPYGPNSGGQSPYQQGPPGYPGVPEQPSGRMPGTAITVRVLMFIGGVVGILFGGPLLLIAVLAGGDNEFSQGLAEGLQDAGAHVDSAEAAIVMAIVGGVMFAYGIASTALASFMGRRSAVVLWLVVVFQVLVALLLVLGVVGGGLLSSVPLFFAIGMIVLMVIPATRAYYTPSQATPYTGY